MGGRGGAGSGGDPCRPAHLPPSLPPSEIRFEQRLRLGQLDAELASRGRYVLAGQEGKAVMKSFGESGRGGGISGHR